MQIHEKQLLDLHKAINHSPYSSYKQDVMIRVELQLDGHSPTLPKDAVLEITDTTARITEIDTLSKLVPGSELKIIRNDRSPAKCFQVLMNLMLEDEKDEDGMA